VLIALNRLINQTFDQILIFWQDYSDGVLFYWKVIFLFFSWTEVRELDRISETETLWPETAHFRCWFDWNGDRNDFLPLTLVSWTNWNIAS